MGGHRLLPLSRPSLPLAPRSTLAIPTHPRGRRGRGTMPQPLSRSTDHSTTQLGRVRHPVCIEPTPGHTRPFLKAERVAGGANAVIAIFWLWPFVHRNIRERLHDHLIRRAPATDRIVRGPIAFAVWPSGSMGGMWKRGHGPRDVVSIARIGLRP